MAPSRYSITKKLTRSVEPTSNNVQMCGWLRLATARASRSKRRCSSLIAPAERTDYLDGDRAIQSRVARLVHVAHAAGTDERHDFVWAEAGSSAQDAHLQHFTEPAGCSCTSSIPSRSFRRVVSP